MSGRDTGTAWGECYHCGEVPGPFAGAAGDRCPECRSVLQSIEGRRPTEADSPMTDSTPAPDDSIDAENVALLEGRDPIAAGVLRDVVNDAAGQVSDDPSVDAAFAVDAAVDAYDRNVTPGIRADAELVVEHVADVLGEAADPNRIEVPNPLAVAESQFGGDPDV